MTSLTSSAPGKVVLLGEYAVLVGASALVAAVDRRARVSLTATGQRGWTVDAPSLGVTGARCCITPGGQVHWSGRIAAHRLGLVSTVLSALNSDGRAPSARITLDTDELYADAQADAARRTVDEAPQPAGSHRHTKLGLGSSAALTVALAGALAGALGAAAGDGDLGTEELLRTHRRLQDGRGSGIDIAAALHGGVLRYSHDAAGAQVQPVTLPPTLTWCCVWTGRPASTRTFLTRIATWQAAEPDHHHGLMDQLARTSAAGVDAVERQDAAAVLDAVDTYARLLERLGEASGADIVCAEHRQIGAIAAASGVSYKSCGAGGGDIGVALTTELDRLATFRERAAQAGFQPLDLAVDPLGLSVHTGPN